MIEGRTVFFMILLLCAFPLISMQEEKFNSRTDVNPILYMYGSSLTDAEYLLSVENTEVAAYVLSRNEKMLKKLCQEQHKDCEFGLYVAVERRIISVVQFLLNEGVDPAPAFVFLSDALQIGGPFIKDPLNLSTYLQLQGLLHEKLQGRLLKAVIDGNVALAKQLLAIGVDPNGVLAQDEKRRSLLWVAATLPNIHAAQQLVALLLKHDAKVDTYSGHDQPLIEDVLLMGGRQDIYDLLVQYMRRAGVYNVYFPRRRHLLEQVPWKRAGYGVP
jgi:hypothetical protein